VDIAGLCHLTNLQHLAMDEFSLSEEEALGLSGLVELTWLQVCNASLPNRGRRQRIHGSGALLHKPAAPGPGGMLLRAAS